MKSNQYSVWFSNVSTNYSSPVNESGLSFGIISNVHYPYLEVTTGYVDTIGHKNGRFNPIVYVTQPHVDTFLLLDNLSSNVVNSINNNIGQKVAISYLCLKQDKHVEFAQGNYCYYKGRSYGHNCCYVSKIEVMNAY